MSVMPEACNEHRGSAGHGPRAAPGGRAVGLLRGTGPAGHRLGGA